ncbi:hypothetical protein C6Y11_08315 [Lactiplantibacillus pentosus]|jgi:hypothetical protein|uniref:hypothetical protein n=1 Tax=Lactiplantibacillus pentosus TaxID=1589 RepID=UPI000D01C3F7|nr:hypothetical protein [Lactiplantibacillus pentosus]MCT3283265.1 hypothetical protein [Lactiplantibacillus pentosus]MCT3302763.1 hypothetical protein [Lactiplantibacillus pentosus]PRO80265.1 hypothetical protein C6Y11_08315 [Lactiplantibacillus pentosus]PRO83027.1 hypothetical protein C6Y09_03880 [Lactiplantibacillus pentosus]PRO92500.1 hypothetical protein C6Y12_05430 [Lactiplantibacillus pentosus]
MTLYPEQLLIPVFQSTLLNQALTVVGYGALYWLAGIIMRPIVRRQMDLLEKAGLLKTDQEVKKTKLDRILQRTKIVTVTVAVSLFVSVLALKYDYYYVIFVIVSLKVCISLLYLTVLVECWIPVRMLIEKGSLLQKTHKLGAETKRLGITVIRKLEWLLIIDAALKLPVALICLSLHLPQLAY